MKYQVSLQKLPGDIRALSGKIPATVNITRTIRRLDTSRIALIECSGFFSSTQQAAGAQEKWAVGNQKNGDNTWNVGSMLSRSQRLKT